MKKETVVIFIIVIIIVIVIRSCVNSVTGVLQTAIIDRKSDSASYSQKAPREYVNIFKAPDKLTIEETDKSKRRNDISKFYYGKQFYLLVYKIDTLHQFDLTTDISENFKASTIPLNTNYSYDDNDFDFKVLFREGAREKVSSVVLNLFGENTKILLKNDSIAYYYSNFENFSITNNHDVKGDIYGIVKKEFVGEKIPIEILFLKRNNNLYFILLGVKNSKISLDNNLLRNLIK